MLLRGGGRPWGIIVDINGLVRCCRSSSSVREVSVVTGMYLHVPPKADDRKGRRHVCSLLNTHRPFHVISINSPSLPCAMSVTAPMCVRYHSFCHFEYQSFQELRRHHRTSPTGVLGLSFCTLRIHRLVIDQSKLDSWAYLTPDP